MPPEPVEVLQARWDTPKGRAVRARAMRNLRLESGNQLAGILRELRGASEVEGGIDLRYVRLDGEKLDGCRLANADLTGADLAKTSFVRADLRNARLVGARLVGSYLEQADLSGADLTDANLLHAHCDGAILVRARLVRANLTAASLREASLTASDLREAVLAATVVEGADFSGASVVGAKGTAQAFHAAATQPEGLGALVVEVPVLPRLPSASIDVAHLRFTARRASLTPAPPGVAGERPSPVPVAVPAPASREVDVEALVARATGRSRTSLAGAVPAPSRPAAAPPRPAAARPAAGTPGEPGRNWDVAVGALLQLRGKCTRIAVVVDGRERVLFEKAP